MSSQDANFPINVETFKSLVKHMRGETTDDNINIKTDAQVEYLTQQIPHQGHKQFGDTPSHLLQFKQNILKLTFWVAQI